MEGINKVLLNQSFIKLRSIKEINNKGKVRKKVILVYDIKKLKLKDLGRITKTLERLRLKYILNYNFHGKVLTIVVFS
jgi:hypothetical protein